MTPIPETQLLEAGTETEPLPERYIPATREALWIADAVAREHLHDPRVFEALAAVAEHVAAKRDETP